MSTNSENNSQSTKSSASPPNICTNVVLNRVHKRVSLRFALHNELRGSMPASQPLRSSGRPQAPLFTHTRLATQSLSEMKRAYNRWVHTYLFLCCNAPPYVSERLFFRVERMIVMERTRGKKNLTSCDEFIKILSASTQLRPQPCHWLSLTPGKTFCSLSIKLKIYTYPGR